MAYFMHLTKTQNKLLRLMAEGRQLWSMPAGFELSGQPFWPRQKSTVMRLIKLGLIKFDARENNTQRQCGMLTLCLTHNQSLDSDGKKPPVS
jgi:hypothetical protein